MEEDEDEEVRREEAEESVESLLLSRVNDRAGGVDDEQPAGEDGQQMEEDGWRTTGSRQMLLW